MSIAIISIDGSLLSIYVHIDVLAPKQDLDATNETQRNIKTIQIVRVEDSNLYRKEIAHLIRTHWSDRLIGKHVRVTGQLYSRVIRVVLLATHFEEI